MGDFFADFDWSSLDAAPNSARQQERVEESTASAASADDTVVDETNTDTDLTTEAADDTATAAEAGEGAQGAASGEADTPVVDDDKVTQLRSEYDAKIAEMTRTIDALKPVQDLLNERGLSPDKLPDVLKAAGVQTEAERAAALEQTQNKTIAKNLEQQFKSELGAQIVAQMTAEGLDPYGVDNDEYFARVDNYFNSERIKQDYARSVNIAQTEARLQREVLSRSAESIISDPSIKYANTDLIKQALQTDAFNEASLRQLAEATHTHTAKVVEDAVSAIKAEYDTFKTSVTQQLVAARTAGKADALAEINAGKQAPQSTPGKSAPAPVSNERMGFAQAAEHDGWFNDL